MVSIAIGLAIVTALLSLLVSTNRHNAELARSGQLSESGRFALQLLADEISHAGFWGGYVPGFDDLTRGTTGFPTAVPDPCLDFNVTTPQPLWDDQYKANLLGIPVQTYRVASPVPSPTVPVCAAWVANPVAGSDFLTLRGVERCAADSSARCTAKDSGEVFFQFNRCPDVNGAPDDRWVISAVPSDLNLQTRPCDGTASASADWFRYVSNLYYVRGYAVTGGDGIPTLMVSRFRASSTGGVVSRQHHDPQPLIPGVQALVVELGLDNQRPNPAGGVYTTDYSGGVTWLDPTNRQLPTNRGDGLPDTWVRCGTQGCTRDQLVDVVAVRLHVLVRSETASPGYTNAKTYLLGDMSFGPFNDGFRRNVYSRTVRLHNVSMRRETPQ